MGNRFPPVPALARARSQGRPRRRGPRSEIEPTQPLVGRELPEPLEGRQALVAPMRPGGVVELIEAAVGLHELAETPTARAPGALLGVDPVAPLDLPVQVRAPGPDGAVLDPGRRTGQGERVEPDRLVGGGLRRPHGPSS